MASFITPVEISPGANAAWTDVDLSSYIPAGATGVILHLYNTHASSGRSVGFRKNGSSDNRTRSLDASRHSWVAIGVDGSRIVELYTSVYADFDIFLVGYFTDDAVFFTNAPDKSFDAPLSTWTDIDISGDTGADTAIGAIFEVEGASGDAALRKNGSSDNRVANVGIPHGGYLVGVDGSEICEGWTSSVAYNFFLVGYIVSSATFNTNATDVSIGSTDIYVDLSALPSGGIGGCYEIIVSGGSISDYALRKNGSSEDIYADTPNGRAYAVVEADASRVVEAKIQATAVDMFLMGYFTGPVTTTKTILGKSDILKSTAQTILGKAFIATKQTILGKADILKAATQTILGKANIAAAAGEWYNANWGYRKAVTITGQSGAGTDYQVQLKIGESAGSSGYDFHLAGHSGAFPTGENVGGDLRFTDNDKVTTLSFWVEKVTGSVGNRTAYVWVKVADSLESNVDIYCYYGYAAATNASSGTNTFLYFDTFDSDTSANYTQVGTGTWTMDTANSRWKCKSTATYSFQYPTAYTNNNCRMRAKMTYLTQSGSEYLIAGIVGRFADANNYLHVRGRMSTSTGYNPRFYSWIGGVETKVFGSASNTETLTAYVYELGMVSATNALKGGVVDGSYTATYTATNSGLSANNKLGLEGRTQTTNDELAFDWWFVSKWISGTEPAFSSAAAEETAPVGATTKTILGLARIELVTAKTILGKARVALITAQTILGKARVALVTAQTILGKAAILKTATQTILGKSSVLKSATQTITGLARITASTTKTILGLANIASAAPTTQTILGKSRIALVTTKTIQGLARIALVTDKTITGKSRVTVSTDRTILGKAKIQIGLIEKTILGKARVALITSQTITGLSRLAIGTNRTILGLSRITVSTTKFILGKADILKAATQPILGKARVALITTQAILGKARIELVTTRTILGKARLTVSTTNNILGIANITVTVTTPRTILGLARVTVTTTKTILGKAAILITTSQTISGIARIVVATTRTLTGISRISISTDRVITGLAKISTTTSQTIQGLSRISLITTKTILGKANIVTLSIRTILGKAAIKITTAGVITGVARIIANIPEPTVGREIQISLATPGAIINSKSVLAEIADGEKDIKVSKGTVIIEVEDENV